ncbi:MAG: sigma-70 family RNA polymerase sigma factor [Verrucomicrobiae bacterium]|nr:sigma-70 family RNA polymerase sigma factor [Verrucomicrobiae bacterium]
MTGPVPQNHEHEALFKCWLAQHSGLVFKVARAFSRSDADRADLVQDILVQLWLSLPRFEGKSRVSTWIYRVALNTALAWRRSETKRHATHAMEFCIEELPAPPDDALAAEREETVARLYAAIRQLPEAEAALVLLHLDDLSYREMAAVLGISESNVGVRLHRARKSLGQLMKENAYEPR